MTYRLYFRFIRFSLGAYDGKEFLSGEALAGWDWDDFYRFAKKQALSGVVFEGIQRLPRESAPCQNLLMTWFGQSQRIRNRNILLNRASAYIYNKVRREGLRCCILKGQGNALMYPNPYSRTPGDVDVWVNEDREKIRKFARLLADTIGEESINHIELTVNGIAVELHSTPAIMNNPVHNRRLQRWLMENADLQCGNMVALPDETGNVAVPTTAFNAVYQLFHLYHHYFYEGVGLRQIIDYYFVVCGLSHEDTDLAVLEHELKSLGLWKFAGAVMYVLHEVMGLTAGLMIAPMDEKRGKMLLDEILRGGNFGQYAPVGHLGKGALGHNVQRLCRDLRLALCYPGEALSEPLFRIGHYFWRLKNRK